MLRNRRLVYVCVTLIVLFAVYILFYTSRQCVQPTTTIIYKEKDKIQISEDIRPVHWTKNNHALKMDEMFLSSVRTSAHLYFYQGRLIIPPIQTLMFFSRRELEDLYHLYIENTQISCNHMIHYGREGDGGYYYCMDVGLRHPCMMYSFGDGQKDHQRSERIWFHAIGLGGATRTLQVDKGTWNIYSLTDIRKLLRHEDRTLDILKIDTEGMIWETLEDITSGGKMDDVKLLIMELHINFPKIPGEPYSEYRTQKDYIVHLQSLRKLYDLGFRHYYFQRWESCVVEDDDKNLRTGCHDVHFVQTKHLPYYNEGNLV